MHFQNSELSFLTKNASVGHFQQVSMNFITISTFQNFNNGEKSDNKRYRPLSFSKYNKTSPKLIYSEETTGRVMDAKFQLISMENAGVLNRDR